MGPYAYYRMRTPAGTGVSARVSASPNNYGGGVYLAVGSPLRMALTRDEAHAAVAVLVAALGDESPPNWALVDIDPTDAHSKPLTTTGGTR